MKLFQNEELLGPLPLGVAVIDSSILLFGSIFPQIANKHRLQILDHFVECIRLTKSSRAEAVSINVYAALLAALKNLTEAKTSIGQENVKKAATTLIVVNVCVVNASMNFYFSTRASLFLSFRVH